MYSDQFNETHGESGSILQKGKIVRIRQCAVKEVDKEMDSYRKEQVQHLTATPGNLDILCHHPSLKRSATCSGKLSAATGNALPKTEILFGLIQGVMSFLHDHRKQ